MSRKATSEYVGVTRRRYATASPAKRRINLKDLVDTTGYEREYANKLLARARRFKEHPGRGAYSEESAAVLKRIWRETGCMSTKYLKSKISEWVEDFNAHVAVIPLAQGRCS